MMKEISCIFDGNNIQMNIEVWIKRTSIVHSKYEKIKQNCRRSNVVNQMLDTLSGNMKKKMLPVE